MGLSHKIPWLPHEYYMIYFSIHGEWTSWKNKNQSRGIPDRESVRQPANIKLYRYRRRNVWESIFSAYLQISQLE